MERFFAIRTDARQAADDLFHGQIVVIWARWFVVLAVAVLALWSTDSTGALASRAALVVILMAVNFILHGRAIVGRPANQGLLLLAGLADLALIGAMIAFGSDRGAASELYVLYYPLVFAWALVFVPRVSAFLGIAAVGSYLAICLLADPGVVLDAVAAKAVVARALTLAATAVLGVAYWRIQRRRRAEAERVPAGLLPASR